MGPPLIEIYDPMLENEKPLLYRASWSKSLMFPFQTQPIQSPPVPRPSINIDLRPIFTTALF